MNTQPSQADFVTARAAFARRGGEAERLGEAPAPLLPLVDDDHERGFGRLCDLLGFERIFSPPDGVADITGERAGFLTARRFSHSIDIGRGSKSVWWWRCECGNTVQRWVQNVRAASRPPRCGPYCEVAAPYYSGPSYTKPANSEREVKL